MKFINHLKIAHTAGFTFKKYKVMAADDGPCWSADVCLEGKKIGAVSDGGFGGPLEIDMTEAAMDRLVKALKAAGYVLDLRIEGTDIVLEERKNSYEWLELVLPDLANCYDDLKFWKSKCKNKIIVRLKGDKERAYTFYSQPYTAEAAKLVRESQGADLVMIVNEEIVGL